jgi:hypothetical protein
MDLKGGLGCRHQTCSWFLLLFEGRKGKGFRLRRVHFFLLAQKETNGGF